MLRKKIRKARRLHAEMLRQDAHALARVEAMRQEWMPRTEWMPEQITLIPPPGAHPYRPVESFGERA